MEEMGPLPNGALVILQKGYCTVCALTLVMNGVPNQAIGELEFPNP